MVSSFITGISHFVKNGWNQGSTHQNQLFPSGAWIPGWNETWKRNKGHFVKGGVQVSNMEGVPDVAYDEVKESHYREGDLIQIGTLPYGWSHHRSVREK